jgi:hypothetical protein
MGLTEVGNAAVCGHNLVRDAQLRDCCAKLKAVRLDANNGVLQTSYRPDWCVVRTHCWSAIVLREAARKTKRNEAMGRGQEMRRLF